MRNPFLLALLGLVVLLALASGSALLFRLCYALGALVLVAYLWNRWGLSGLEGQVQRLTPNPQVGQWLEARVTLQNMSWLPKVLLQVHPQADLSGEAGGRLVSLPPRGSVSWITRTRCLSRGRYALGTLRVEATDPVGLFQRRMTLGEPQFFLVYPATIELGSLWLPAGIALGEGYYQSRLQPASPAAGGLREYVSGDSSSRIHWPSTARLGRLMVKEFDRDPAGSAGELWIVLDLDESAQAGQGPQSTEEYGVTIAASIAKKYLDMNRAVGLVAWGNQHYVFPAARGAGQLDQIMEALALLRPQGRSSLAGMVSTLGEHIGASPAVIIITTSRRKTIKAALSYLMGRGVGVTVILLDAASFGGQASSEETMDWLATCVVDTYLVRQGDEIDKVLDSRRRSRFNKLCSPQRLA